MAMAMAMARKTTTMTIAMAVKALLLLALLSGAAIADLEEAMPALGAHIREIQRLTHAARGDKVVEEAELFGIATAPAPVEPEDATSEAMRHLFHHINEVKQMVAEKVASSNGEDDVETGTNSFGFMETRHDETEEDAVVGSTDPVAQLKAEEPDMVPDLVTEPGEEEETVPEMDTSELMAHLSAVKREAAKNFASLNGDDETETATETEKFEFLRVPEDGKPVEPMDSRVLERLNQLEARLNHLEAALKLLNEEDGAELSADGAHGEDAPINLLDEFARARQHGDHDPVHARHENGHGFCREDQRGVEGSCPV